jgi:hypothetical protein
MLALAALPPVESLIYFLIVVAVAVLVFILLKWLIGQAGWNPPPPFWPIIGFIFCLLILLYALRVFGVLR